MSKSGLFAHFGSKEDLQVATVEAARAIFIKEVIRPAFGTAQGLTRLWNLCDTWLGYVQSGVFRGGRFFSAAPPRFFGRAGPGPGRNAELVEEGRLQHRGSGLRAATNGQLHKNTYPN